MVSLRTAYKETAINQLCICLWVFGMVAHRLDSILVVYPRSGSTLVQFGLHDETFMVPDWEIPTVVYRKKVSSKIVYFADNDGADSDLERVEPLKQGEIVDLEAFLQFLKLVYTSLLASKSSQNSEIWNNEFSNIPLLLVSNFKWSQLQQEVITQYVFEHLKIGNFVLLPSSLAASFSMVSLQNCCVIDIGTSHTDIVPVMDYTQIDFLATKINVGGQSINDSLRSLLPDLTDEQIEDLKKSTIFEVLSDDAKKDSAFDFQADTNNDDEVLDVAEIVTSSRNTREILEERERSKTEKDIPNAKLETNTFHDRAGTPISVGKQRFQGCNLLIKSISKAVGNILAQIDDHNKVSSIWENIIIIGGSSGIVGFKEALLVQMIKDHLIVEPEQERLQREQEAIGSLPSKKKTKFIGSSFVPTMEYQQAPSTIKLAKYPEYFPEWKKHGYSKIAFLGAQIVAKQIFTHSNDSFSITREKYNAKGPSSLWEVDF